MLLYLRGRKEFLFLKAVSINLKIRKIAYIQTFTYLCNRRNSYGCNENKEHEVL